MELSINSKVTNKQLDKMCMEKGYAMNSLGITLTYEFVERSVDFNWCDILLAIESRYILYEVAKKYASVELEWNDSSDVLELAILTDNELERPHLIHPYLDRLAEEVSEQDKAKAKHKILYLALKWTFENKKFFEDPLRVVEFIFADFNYPRIIAHFVRYMPMIESDLGSTELNVAKLLSKWESYLDEQEQLYKKD